MLDHPAVRHTPPRAKRCPDMASTIADALSDAQPPSTRPKVVTWREQPDLGELAAAVLAVSGGRVHLEEVDTGSDEHALIVSGRRLSLAEAVEAYEEYSRDARAGDGHEPHR